MKKKRNRSILLRLLVLGVCGYMLVTLAGLWSTLNNSRAELNNLKQEYEAKKNDIDQLSALMEDGSEEQIIEKAARERLGYVFADEKVFVDISGS